MLWRIPAHPFAPSLEEIDEVAPKKRSLSKRVALSRLIRATLYRKGCFVSKKERMYN